MPHATPPSATIGQEQPPSTITAIFNPMMGHISTAYAARVSRDLSVCSRFDFNIYSYESEWTMGTEWWVRSSFGGGTIPRFVGLSPSNDQVDALAGHNAKDDNIQGVVKARISTNTVSYPYNKFNVLPSICLGHFFDVGRSATKYPHKLRCGLRSRRWIKAYSCHRP
jgi:hypothetical protein